MKVEVSTAIEELRRQFAAATVTVLEDGQGGARVVMDPVTIGPRYRPSDTWIGFQIPAQYPYADIYPVFIGGNVVRADGKPFVVPVTPGHNFEGRPALQVSRRNSAAQSGLQKAPAKILKILDFLENLA
ncbi:MAG: hypothetical protein WAU89_25810 [Candidatus Acidiferrales bacterium]